MARVELPLAGGLLAIQAVLLGLQLGLTQLGRPVVPFAATSLTIDAVAALGTLAFAIVGFLIVARRPGNPIGWLFLLANLGWTVSNAATTYVEYATIVSPLPAPGPVVWLATWPGPISLTAYALLVLLFPNGRALTARWRRFTLFAVAFGAVDATMAAFASGPVGAFQLDGLTVDNPLGVNGVIGQVFEELADGLFQLGSVAVFAIAAAGLVVRLRRSEGVEHQQVKWLAWAVGVTVLLWLTNVPIMVAWDSLTDAPAWARAWNLVATNGEWIIPVAAAIAILRHRLYDIDRLVSRTVGWGLVTVVLAAAFVAAVVGLEDLLAGVTQGQTLAVAASTLGALVVFQPLRRRIQERVDRRFDRAGYDAQRIVDAFAKQIRSQVDLTQIRLGILVTVDTTMRPELGSVWLRSAADRPDRDARSLPTRQTADA